MSNSTPRAALPTTPLPDAFQRECKEIAGALKRHYGRKRMYHGQSYYDFEQHPFIGRAGALLLKAAGKAQPAAQLVRDIEAGRQAARDGTPRDEAKAAGWLIGWDEVAYERTASKGADNVSPKQDEQNSPSPSFRGEPRMLSDEEARLSEDDLHARSWWCPTCKKDVPPEMVTKDGEHYLEAGGCGYAVRSELIEDQPKQPLSDEEIHRIWMETPERPTLAEEVLAFGRTLLSRAGIGESRHE